MTEPEYNRPDPDSLLQAIQRADERRRRGRLKIFLGMCAGVGKTYAMLAEARQMAARGQDVVIGYLETHGRRETEELANGLALIPRRRLEHRGIIREEMDLDAVLARRPQTALVDELAHTNAPGSRHSRRFQEVLELIDQGIDVLTTVNVQHLESQADIVEQLTGVAVKERIPDTILDLAAEIELIDISPEEHEQRLKEGKVYQAERAVIAAQNFFRRSNLQVLREMALATTARQVDREIKANLGSGVYQHRFRSRERILVAIGPHPQSARLVRLCRRLAGDELAELFALHVDTGAPLSEEDRLQIQKNLELAREVGATPLQSAGDLAECIAQVARRKGITQIVVGKSQGRSLFAQLLRGPTLADRLLALCPGIDLHIVPDRETEISRLLLPDIRPQSPWRQYLSAALAIAAATVGNLALHDFTPYWAPSIIYLFVVSALGVWLGRGPTMLAATLSALLWNVLFIPPRFTLYISRVEDILMLFTYFAVAAATSVLTGRIKKNRESLEKREEMMSALFELSAALSSAADRKELATKAVEQISRAFGYGARLLVARDGRLEELARVGLKEMGDREMAVADWSFRNSRPAGRHTDTLPESAETFQPLFTPAGAIGVISLSPAEPLSLVAANLLQSMSSQIAFALSRSLAEENERRMQVLQESEHLYQIVMNSLSHELRSPLTAIVGAASALKIHQVDEKRNLREGLIETIAEAAERLQRLVRQLLDMSRLESGHLELKRERIYLRDLLAESISMLTPQDRTRLQNEPGGEDLVLAVDPGLMVQVFTGLFGNALRYSDPASTVTVRTLPRAGDRWPVAIEVLDSGPVAAELDLSRIFEKFYRGPGAPPGGTGLGLALSRGIVRLHGGELRVARNDRGGLSFVVEIPPGEPGGQ